MASSNAGKIREIERLLHKLGIGVVAQSELAVVDAEETGTTFAENSLLKARHACNATGLAAIADDSGLVVDALAGAPGVYSARFAGPHADDAANIDKLLAELECAKDRSAAFHCVATLVLPGDEEPITATGVWRGSILTCRQGDGGFGYDAVFLDPASGRSGAQLSVEEKNARSHRGIALRALLARIEQRFT
jgi:XTP/dITP diphosphohydrolase